VGAVSGDAGRAGAEATGNVAGAAGAGAVLRGGVGAADVDGAAGGSAARGDGGDAAGGVDSPPPDPPLALPVEEDGAGLVVVEALESEAGGR
jgi:hypothetical protein